MSSNMTRMLHRLIWEIELNAPSELQIHQDGSLLMKRKNDPSTYSTTLCSDEPALLPEITAIVEEISGLSIVEGAEAVVCDDPGAFGLTGRFSAMGISLQDGVLSFSPVMSPVMEEPICYEVEDIVEQKLV